MTTGTSRLQGKAAVVVGAASGIGRATALRFAEEGADVFCADKNVEGAEATGREVMRRGRVAAWGMVDVTKVASIDEMVSSAISKLNRIDILVNSAGVGPVTPIPDVTEAEWDFVLGVQLKGTFFTVQRVLPQMKKQGKGKIINIASVFGQVGNVNTATYCAAKGGVINLTRQMALELAPWNINVNAIGPGTTDTPLIKALSDNPEAFRAKLAIIPLGRIARAEEIAGAAAYLASGEADYITGQTLFMDGGQLAR